MRLVQALILDMDGVLWKDDQSIGDLPAIFYRLRTKHIQVLLATNNATRTPEQHLQKLARFGVEIEPWQVINSADAAAYRLKQDFPAGGPVFMIGEEGLEKALKSQGFYQAVPSEKPIAVVGGLDRRIGYEKLRAATLLIRSGLPFYFTNPDRTFPTPDGLVPGAGAIMASLVASTDVQPIIAGKPSPDMYYMALELLKVNVEDTLAVGDRLETDILGGQRAGCRTALVLSGVSTMEDVNKWDPKPDIITSDLTELVDML